MNAEEPARATERPESVPKKVEIIEITAGDDLQDEEEESSESSTDLTVTSSGTATPTSDGSKKEENNQRKLESRQRKTPMGPFLPAKAILKKNKPDIFKNSFEALEKCIEWLSYHPAENLNIPDYHTKKEMTKRELLEYRQKAVRHWVDTIPDSSGSDMEDDVRNNYEVFDDNANIEDERLYFKNPGMEKEPGKNDLISNFILSKLPKSYSLNTAGGRKKVNVKAEMQQHRPEGHIRCPRTTRRKTREDIKNKGVVYYWVARHLPFLERCWKKVNTPPGNDLTTEDKEKLQINKLLLQEGNANNPGSSDTTNPLRDELGESVMTDNNNDEIQRLTNLLQNTPKSTMRTIFSLRKERIPPEKPAPPSFFTKVSRQFHGFFSGRHRTQAGGTANQRNNRSNRVNPSTSLDSRSPQGHPHATSAHPAGQPQTYLPYQNQNTMLQNVLRLLWNKKPTVSQPESSGNINENN